MQSSVAQVKYYRPRRPGPEEIIEGAVLRALDDVLPRTSLPTWVACSLMVGAGMPDLLAVSLDPRVVAIADPDIADSSVLAYLRAVGCARFDTIVDVLGRKPANLSASLNALVDAAVVADTAEGFSLEPVWRAILPEVVSIEAKVSNWRKAIHQAARNQLFSHRSFVALPPRVAERALEDESLSLHGIGVLSVTQDGAVAVVRQAVAREPMLWAYYYHLAHHVARTL